MTIISTPTGDQDATLLKKIPSRVFRDAWRLDGDAIAIDLTAAREIQKARLREARKAVFVSIDGERAIALENGDQVALASIKQRSDALRNVTKDSALSNANTPEDIDAFWPDYLPARK